jgi:hypothetical protein
MIQRERCFQTPPAMLYYPNLTGCYYEQHVYVDVPLSYATSKESNKVSGERPFVTQTVCCYLATVPILNHSITDTTVRTSASFRILTYRLFEHGRFQKWTIASYYLEVIQFYGGRRGSMWPRGHTSCWGMFTIKTPTKSDACKSTSWLLGNVFTAQSCKGEKRVPDAFKLGLTS